MSGSVNKVILVGNLAADPETRSMNNGGEVTSFRVATSESWTDRSTGERKDKTEWHSVVIFNEHLIKIAKQYLRKGSKVYLEGQLQTRKWQDQSGADRYSTEIVLQRYRGELTLLGDAPGANRTQNGGGSRSEADRAAIDGQRGGGGGDFQPDLDDDVPFAHPYPLDNARKAFI